MAARYISPLPAPGSGITAFGDPGNINSTGTPTALTGNLNTNGLHLDASGGPVGDSGYFLVGTSFSDPGIALSQGQF